MSTEGPEGPFRQNARPPELGLPWSTAAAASFPLVASGWAIAFFALNRMETLIWLGLLMLLVGGVAGAIGLVETKPRPQEDPDLPHVSPYRGRGLAKAALVSVLGPVLLACVVFGLILLTCGGH